VSPLLRHQRLSHYAFHKPSTQLLLARLAAPPPPPIVIGGVEWGTDALALARAGYRVVGVEPLSHFVDHVRGVAEREGLDIRMVHAAAGATSGEQVTVNYENAGAAGVETVTAVTVDEVLDGEPAGAPPTVAVLAVDIQGDEAAVLAGADRALRRASIASVWVEVIACNVRVRPMLDGLDTDFVLFDFCPWGAPRAAALGGGPPRSADAFVDEDLPRAITPWGAALCAAQRRSFTWLQTDVVGLRRDLLTPTVVSLLADLGADVCGEPGVCVMREAEPRRVGGVAAAAAAVRAWWDHGPPAWWAAGRWEKLWGARGRGGGTPEVVRKEL